MTNEEAKKFLLGKNEYYRKQIESAERNIKQNNEIIALLDSQSSQLARLLIAEGLTSDEPKA